MKFLSSLNIYKKLNNGEITICKISIFTLLFIIIFDKLLYQLISSPLLSFLSYILPKENYNFNIFIFIIEFFSATFSLLIISSLFKNTKNRRDSIPKAQTTSEDFFYAALIIIGFRFFYEGSLSHLTHLMPIPETIVNAFESMSSDYTYLLLSICIFAPFIEEFMYRGILLNGLLKKYSPPVAMILSSLIFAIAHMNLPQGINAFILGLLLALVYYKTHSLYLCIFMHFINNLCANFITIIPINLLFIIIQSILFMLIGGLLMYFSFKKFKLINNTII